MSDALSGHFLAAVIIAALLGMLHRNGRRGARSGLAPLVVGADNRLSTSKTMVSAWTLAIFYGLLSLLIAKALGNSSGWDALTGPEGGLQEEYLILLGGPYAAAIVAKVSAVGQTVTEGKPPATTVKPNVGQLISDDAGDTDLGDLQYVLFNLVALGFFLVDFWSHSDLGFPNLPSLLAGLVLTSAGGYAAKKLIRQSGPTLTSVVPPTAPPGATAVLLYGANLVIPANVAPDGVALPPMVSLGSLPVTVTAHQQILGADRLTILIPAGAEPGAALISVVRADGIAALGPAGADGVPFTVI
jgi:hypothetical protein